MPVVDRGETTLRHKPTDAEARYVRGDTCPQWCDSRERPAPLFLFVRPARALFLCEWLPRSG